MNSICIPFKQGDKVELYNDYCQDTAVPAFFEGFYCDRLGYVKYVISIDAPVLKLPTLNSAFLHGTVSSLVADPSLVFARGTHKRAKI